VLVPASVLALAPLVLEDGRGAYRLGARLELLEDAGRRLSIDEVAAPALASAFVASGAEVPNLGLTRAAYWARVRLRDESATAREWLLEVSWPVTDLVSLFVPDGAGGFVRKQAGDSLPFAAWEIPYRNPTFRLPVRPGWEGTVYLRFEGEDTMLLPVTLWSADAFARKRLGESFTYGFYYGVLALLVAYHLVPFVTLRDRTYLYYVLLILAWGLYHASLSGFASQYLWPDSPTWARWSVHVAATLAFTFSAVFARSFLLTKTYAPALDRCLSIFAVAGAGFLAWPVFGGTIRSFIATAGIVNVAGATLLPVAGFRCWRAGYRPARYYLLTWSVGISALLVWALRGFGIAPSNFITDRAFELLVLSTAITLSLGLADRVNVLTRDLESLNRGLEARIAARTADLARRSEELERLYGTVDDQARQLAEWNRRLEERVTEQVAQLERLGRLKRFLPPEIAERVVAGSADDPLRSHRREIAVVFLELRGFAAFAETSAPEEVMAVLQEYHLAIGGVVGRYQGTLARVTGEGMMVVFNDVVPQPDAAERAVRMALAMRDRSAELSARWEKRGVALKLGFGVAQGYATLGAVGVDARSDYAAVGTVTSMAARLCDEARPGEILVCRRVAAAAEDVAEVESAGDLALRGFSRPVPAFRVLGVKPPSSPAVAAAPPPNVFRREGDYWTIVYGTAAVRLKDSKGLRYIAHLLGRPEQDVHALDLVAATRGDGADPAETRAAGLGDAGTVLDARAKGAYRARLEELGAELTEAEAFGDAGRIARARSEIEFLSRQLAAAVGLGGRDRRAAAAAERARVNVTRAIADGLRRIREHSPALARHLEASIRTGSFCSYRSADLAGVRWEL